MELSQEQLEIINKAFWALDELLESFQYRDYEIKEQTGLSIYECQAILQANKDAQSLLKVCLFQTIFEPTLLNPRK